MAMISQKLPDMYINIFVTIIFCSYLNTSSLNCSDFSNIFFCEIVPVIYFYILRKHKPIVPFRHYEVVPLLHVKLNLSIVKYSI